MPLRWSERRPWVLRVALVCFCLISSFQGVFFEHPKNHPQKKTKNATWMTQYRWIENFLPILIRESHHLRWRNSQWNSPMSMVFSWIRLFCFKILGSLWKKKPKKESNNRICRVKPIKEFRIWQLLHFSGLGVCLISRGTWETEKKTFGETKIAN